MAEPQFNSILLDGNTNLYWSLLLTWILTLCVTIFSLFYMHRSVAFIISKVLYFTLWKKYKVHVNVHSLKISFLAGRIFFKNLTIINKDFTISILHGTLTWRYWLIHTREPAFMNDTPDNANLPCRILFQLYGFEIFMYNRTAAYDEILRQLKLDRNQGQSQTQTHDQDSDNSFEKLSDSMQSLSSQSASKPDECFLPKWFKVAPIAVLFHRCCVVVGNDTVESVLTITSSTSEGTLDLMRPSCQLDLAQFNIDLQSTNVKVLFTPNVAYQRNDSSSTNPDNLLTKRRKLIKALIELVYKLVPKAKSQKLERAMTLDYFVRQWNGLSRYAAFDDELGDTIFSSLNEEYARYSNIVSADSIDVVYFYDIPGKVPVEPYVSTADVISPDIGNNGPPPLSGLNISSSNALIHYGPWADRQRYSLQQMVFPYLCRDHTPIERLKPGDIRKYTDFKITFEVEDTLTLRIPFKESSKNASFLQSLRDRFGEDVNLETINTKRPFAWLELKTNKNSNASISSGSVPLKNGWKNLVNINLKDVELRTSVNHNVLVKATEHVVLFDMSAPLAWNGFTNWTADLKSKDVDFFILREHVTLMLDLFDDFGSGNPTPYEMFKPFHYNINWEIDNYKLYLNINDSNIINNAVDLNDNTFVCLSGASLTSNISIPLETVVRKHNTVSYKIRTDMFHMSLSLPPWHTLSSFCDNKQVGKAMNFELEGEYTYYSVLDINAVDTVIIKCISEDTTLQTYGWIIRYIMIIKENYFGENIHFKTLDEFYQTKASGNKEMSNGNSDDLPTNQNDGHSTINRSKSFSLYSKLFESSSNVPSLEDDYSISRQTDGSSSIDTSSDSISDTDSKDNKPSSILPRTTNETDILFSFCVKNGTIVLPENIYKCNDSHVALNFDFLDIDIRFTNYYMDMQADLSPAKGFEVENTSSNEVLFQRTIDRVYDDWTPDMQVDGLAVHGHRIFGLPPSEPTYFCKWDFLIGSVLIDSRPRFLDRLVNSLKSLAFGYKDVENMLTIDIPVIHDVLCLSLDLKSVDINMKNSQVLLKLCLKELSLTMNDLANSRYTSRMDLDIPMITARLFSLEGERALIAGFETFLVLTNFADKQKGDEFRKLQAERIALHDGPTHRMPFIVRNDLRQGNYKNEKGSIKPSFSLPELPVPLNYSSIDAALTQFPERVQVAIQQDVDNVSFTNSMENGDDTLRLTTDYNENDPNLVTRSNNELAETNLVVKFSKVYGFGSMSGFLLLLSLFEDVNCFTLENTMDNLTFDIVSSLTDFSQPLAEKLCCKVVIPEVHFRLGDFNVPVDSYIKDILKDTILLENVKFLDIEIVNSSITFSTEENRPIIKDIADMLLVDKELLVAVQVKSVQAKLVNNHIGHDSYDMFSISLSEINFWLHSFKTQFGDIGSVDFKDIEVSLKQEDLRDIIYWAQEIDRHIDELTRKLEMLSSLRGEALAYLIYAVCQQESINKVPHDPSVITKPTHILRTSTSHIRGNISWKLVARTRHVLNYLPEEWKVKTNSELVNKSWKNADKTEARNLVVNAFNNWRSWEFENLDECYLFKHILPDTELSTNTNSDDKSLNKIFAVSLGRLMIQLRNKNNDSEENHLKITQIGFELVCTKEPLREDSLVPIPLASDSFLDIQCSLKVALFSSKLTKNLISLKDIFDDVSFTKSEKKTQAPTDQALPIVVSFDFQVSETFSTFTLLNSALVVSSSSTSGSCYVVQEEASPIVPLTFDTSIKKASLGIVFDTDAHIISSSLKETTFNLSSIGTLNEGMKKIDVHTELISLKSLQDHQTWVLLLTSLNEEIPMISSWISNGSTIPENNVTVADSNQLPFLPFPLMVVFNAQLIDIDLEILSAFNIVTDFEKLEVGLECNKDISFMNLEVSRSGLKVLQRKFQERGFIELLRGSIDVFSLDSKASLTNENQPSLEVSTTVGSSYIIVPTLIEGLQNFAQTYDEVIDNIQSASTLIRSIGGSIIDRKTSHSQKIVLQKSFFSTWFLDFAALLTNISFIVKESDSNIKLLFEEINFHCANYDNALDLMKIVPFFGIADLSSIILRMDCKSPINKNFNIVSLGLQLKLLQFEEEDNLQNFQIISTYTRVFLNSFLLLKLVNFYDRLSNATSMFPTKKFIETTDNPHLAIDDTIRNTLESYSIHVLLHNFCIGWIYGTERYQYPGFILGYEKAFVIFHKTTGKISFLGFYLSLAHGATPSDFYGSGNEYESKNCASLPTFKFVYNITKEGRIRKLHAQLFGEMLKIQFEVGSFYAMDYFIDSINSTKELLNQRNRVTNVKISPELGSGNYNSVKGILFFSSIKCLTKFDGAQIAISSKSYSHHSSLPLQMDFPAVKILTEYTKRSISHERPHLVNLRVGISGSDNFFDASSTYVIMEVWNEVKRIVNKPQSPKTPRMSPSIAIESDSHLFTTLEPLFADIEFNFCLHSNPQKLSLSCEPKAKVKMVIALDELTLYLNSNENLDHCVSSLLKVTKIDAYLQHIYSRETSGSLQIKNLLLDGIYEAPDSGRKIAAIADITEIDFYINMKQLQDIDLFKDIWFPRESHSTSSPIKEKKNAFTSTNMSMLNAYRRVSQTVAVQWIFALNLRKVTSKVDLGRSLGLLTFTLEKFDILSQRQINWDQMLKICFKSIDCSTEGRLGGILSVDNVRLNSRLFWNVSEMKDRLTETPFVSLSFDMEAFQMKISLDYHNFFIAQLAMLRLEVFNEKGDESTQSSVVGKASLGSVDLYMTVLAASNFMDIYSNIQRMRHDIRFAYTQVLNDSKLQTGSTSRMSSIETLNDRRKRNRKEKLIDAMDLLLTKLEVSLNSIVVHIFPVSLLEPEALMVKFDQIEATFDQSSGDSLMNSLDLQLNGVRMSLSTIPGEKDETILETISISEYVKRTKGAYGGTIFVFPSVVVKMKSWQDPDTKVVEYIYESYFSGNIDIKWNLGTINFIKEMWTTHARALSSRLNNIGKLSEIEERSDRNSISVPNTRQPSILETVDIEEKINMVATETTFKYIARREPIIDTPQLKDLGIATPPLEWLGVHRNQFPILTHRFVIIGLQKMVHQVEIQYVRLLK